MVPASSMQDSVVPIGLDPINLLWRNDACQLAAAHEKFLLFWSSDFARLGRLRGFANRAFAHDVYAGMLAKHATKPVPGERLIVNDKGTKFDHQVRKGIVTCTVTPFPLVSETRAASPNSSCRRARVLASPMPSSFGG